MTEAIRIPCFAIPSTDYLQIDPDKCRLLIREDRLGKDAAMFLTRRKAEDLVDALRLMFPTMRTSPVPELAAPVPPLPAMWLGADAFTDEGAPR